MEFCLPQLLSREEVLHILKERKLNIPNIENLSLDELLRIYSSFAVPLAKREIKPTSRCKEAAVQPTVTNNKSQESAAKKRLGDDLNFKDLNLTGEITKAKRTKMGENNKYFNNSTNEEKVESLPKKRKIITWP